LRVVYGGYTVAQLVETLRYKPGGRGFYGAIGIFHCLNPSVRSMALVSIQSVKEMSTWVVSWGVKAADAEGRLSRYSGNLNLLEP